MYKENLIRFYNKEELTKQFPIGLQHYEYQFTPTYTLKEYIRFIKDEHDCYYMVHDYGEYGKLLLPLGQYFNDEVYKQNNIDYIQIPEEWLHEFICSWDGMKTVSEEDIDERGFYDYIYDLDLMINHEGKDFEYVRRRYNKFLLTYKNVEIITNNFNYKQKQDVINVLYRCFEECKYDVIEEVDFIEDVMGLTQIDKLFDNCMLIYIDGKPVAYCNSFKITDDTCCGFAFKNLHQYYGLHQYMMVEFSKLLKQSNYKYMNFCYDMGDEGLRFLKEKYRPVKFIKRKFLKYDEYHRYE